MLLNPQTGGFVQGTKHVRPEALFFAALLELAEQGYELRVGAFILRVGRAAVTLHAIFFKLEMRLGVGFQKIYQVEQEFAFLPGGIGFGQHSLQMVDVIDQHPMLLIKLVGACCKPFVPKDHGRIYYCFAFPKTGFDD